MTSIGQLKKVIAAYLRQSVAYFTIDSVDMLLLELNEQRKQLELLHDFNLNRVSANLVVAPAGTLLSAATVNATSVSLKEWQTFYLQDNNGDLLPLRHHTRKHEAVWATEQLEFAHFRTRSVEQIRYPGTSDDTVMTGLGKRPEVFINGTLVTLSPEPTANVTLVVDGVKWMSDWTSDNDTDWMVTYGGNYLKWATIIALNYREFRFLPGLDGNLGAPTKMRDEALQVLTSWDAMQNEAGRNPKGIR